MLYDSDEAMSIENKINSNDQQDQYSDNVLTEAESNQRLVAWNQTQAAYPDKCVHQLFSEQVEQAPEAVAVVFGDQQLTYRALNARANQLAHYLVKQGIGPDVLVGIYIERSLEMLVGLLGIMKAGGAYVPLDPHFPVERLSFMLEDANVRILLTTGTLLTQVESIAPASKGYQKVCLDTVADKIGVTVTDWALISGECDSNPITSVKPKNLAYCIYTSGSTGQPKGVELEHRTVVNFLTSMRHEPGLTDKDTLLAVTTISFDIAGLELYLPLIVGAKVVLTSRETVSSGQLLAQLLNDSGTTVMQATPTTWYLLLAAGWQGNSALKMLCGGESLPQELANQLLTKGASLWNLYGPTETTIWSTSYQVGLAHQTADSQAVRNSNAPELIGRPIANTQIYILDSNKQPVPIGVAGELYIGGAGLARGYRNRQSLTEEKFIPNPFGDGRLYKTGDLARYLPDGQIEFQGRLDHQVKIRGFRIELGEIEALLDQHPTVNRSIVMAQQEQGAESGTNKRLVAYVVPKQVDKEEQSEQVSQWQTIWNHAYSQGISEPDPTFNISGWNDSYTGRPIPSEQMHEWVDHTVNRILSCQPKRLLEIGCGTGMLLFRLAPHCQVYCGTDIANEALRHIEQHLGTLNEKVTLRQNTADNFAGFSTAEFDTVVINSVTQLFPSIDYLVEVLEKAVNVVQPGGTIFVGDVRSLPLIEAFHAAVHLHQAPASLPKAQLQQRIQRSISNDEELFIDPDFFLALAASLPQITQAQIQLKRGQFHNEMTRFRYDVMLHINKPATEISPIKSKSLTWQQEVNLPTLSQLLAERQLERLVIKGVPNARLLGEIKLLYLLAHDEKVSTVEDLRHQLQQINHNEGVEPEMFWALSEELPYHIHITWADLQENYDVICQRTDVPLAPFGTTDQIPVKPWAAYANNPLQGQISRKLEPQWRHYLAERLPDYMVPTVFVILSAFPLTPNGKIDRRALPIPTTRRPELSTALVIPQTEVEQLIATVWREALQLDEVGIHDNFFELGGHSLLLTQVYNKLVKVGSANIVFEPELSVMKLFEYPTIQALAKFISNSNTQTFNNESAKEQPAPPASRQNRQGSMQRLRQRRLQSRTSKED